MRGVANRSHQRGHVPPPSLPAALRLVEAHGDRVARLPPHATLLASSASCPCEIYGVGSSALSMQGHPEFGADIVTERILPALQSSGRLNAAEERAAIESFASHPLDSPAVCRMVVAFLLGGARSVPSEGQSRL